MFSLVKGVYGEMTKREEFSITVLGLDGAGKTTYMEQVKRLLDKNHKQRDLSKISPTVGLNHVKIHSKEFVLNFLDLGGQKELRCLWNKYLDECHALLFVIDSTSAMARFDEIVESIEQIMSVEHVHPIPLLVLLNKCDSADDNGQQLLSNGDEMKQHESQSPPICSDEEKIASEEVAEMDDANSMQSPSSSGWHSFDLDNNTEWEASSDCCSVSTSKIPHEIRNELEEHFGSVHRGDLAIFSISAKQNINVKKSINWLVFALNSYKKELLMSENSTISR